MKERPKELLSRGELTPAETRLTKSFTRHYDTFLRRGKQLIACIDCLPFYAIDPDGTWHYIPEKERDLQ